MPWACWVYQALAPCGFLPYSTCQPVISLSFTWCLLCLGAVSFELMVTRRTLATVPCTRGLACPCLPSHSSLWLASCAGTQLRFAWTCSNWEGRTVIKHRSSLCLKMPERFLSSLDLIFDLSYLTGFISLFLSSLKLGLLWYTCQFCFIVENVSYVAFVF